MSPELDIQIKYFHLLCVGIYTILSNMNGFTILTIPGIGGPMAILGGPIAMAIGGCPG